jgi:hypothetical protein
MFQTFIQTQSILLDQTNDGNEFSYDIFQKMKERFTTTTELSIPFFSFILHPRGLEEFQRTHSKIFSVTFDETIFEDTREFLGCDNAFIQRGL